MSWGNSSGGRSSKPGWYETPGLAEPEDSPLIFWPLAHQSHKKHDCCPARCSAFREHWELQPPTSLKCLLFPQVKLVLIQSSFLPVSQGLRGLGWGCFILKELEEKLSPLNSIGHTPSGAQC